MSKQNNLKDYLTDLYQGIATKKPGASRNPQNFRSEIESIQVGSNATFTEKTFTDNGTYLASSYGADGFSKVVVAIDVEEVSEWDGRITIKDAEGTVVGTVGLAYRKGYGNGEYYYICDGLGTIPYTDIVVGSEYDGLPVKEFKSAAFSSTNITSVVIPNSITSIADDAFYYCQSLARVTIGNGVKTIGVMAFSNCPLLQSITLPEGLTSIGQMAFYGCRGLKSIVMPKSIVSIANQAFGVCENLKDVYYGGSEAEWNAIAIGTDNDPLKNATIHFNS